MPYYSPCYCPSSGISGIPNCHCDSSSDYPSFLSVRWKRIIIDEGHVISNHTSDISQLASRLSAERRWIVTGTPTTHLIGTGLGSRKTPSPNMDDVSVVLPELVTRRRFISSRTWNPEDRKDMLKLSNIFTHFLQLPQFASNHMLFVNAVGNPLMQPTPPTFGAVQIIYQLLSQNMVRHR